MYNFIFLTGILSKKKIYPNETRVEGPTAGYIRTRYAHSGLFLQTNIDFVRFYIFTGKSFQKDQRFGAPLVSVRGWGGDTLRVRQATSSNGPRYSGCRFKFCYLHILYFQF